MPFDDSKNHPVNELMVGYDAMRRRSVDVRALGPTTVKIKTDFGTTTVIVERNRVETHVFEAHDGIIKRGMRTIVLESQADEHTREPKWEAY